MSYYTLRNWILQELNKQAIDRLTRRTELVIVHK